MHLLDRRFGLVAVVMVRAGDPIARGGAHSFELLVADFDFFYCPTDFLGAEVRDEIRQQLRDLMADFESFRGDTTLYDEAALEPSTGCLTDKIALF